MSDVETFGASYDGEASAWYLEGEFVDGMEGESGTIDQMRIGGRPIGY